MEARITVFEKAEEIREESTGSAIFRGIKVLHGSGRTRCGKEAHEPGSSRTWKRDQEDEKR